MVASQPEAALDLLTIIPWLALLLVFLGMAALQWRALSALHELAKLLAQSGPFDAAPAWFKLGLHEIGFHETGTNQGIERYRAWRTAARSGDPWCAIFANAMLEQAGVPGSRSPSSQSFRTHPEFVRAAGPALGCIVVFWRGSKAIGQGHVGFYRGEDATTSGRSAATKTTWCRSRRCRRIRRRSA
jgi:hypothetical protein